VGEVRDVAHRPSKTRYHFCAERVDIIGITGHCFHVISLILQRVQIKTPVVPRVLRGESARLRVIIKAQVVVLGLSAHEKRLMGRTVDKESSARKANAV
jgi:hypothetical protein